MREADYAALKATGKVPATAETFVSTSEAYSKGYNGVLVKFETEAGTRKALENVGKRYVQRGG
jgi:hypothetical protein